MNWHLISTEETLQPTGSRAEELVEGFDNPVIINSVLLPTFASRFLKPASTFWL